MASNIIEFFGYDPHDKSAAAKSSRADMLCPFQPAATQPHKCTKKLSNRFVSGACTLQAKNTGPVICCPVRLYANEYQILEDVAKQVFGGGKKLVIGSNVKAFRATNPNQDCIGVFGKRWGKELRLPNRSESGAYFVDWILAHVNANGALVNFVAIEVQSIDTTGNYQKERQAYLDEVPYAGRSTAGFNWENVSKRILPQIIFKGHVLQREPLCTKGLFFICPTPVYQRIQTRLGGSLQSIHQQPGSVTMMWYDIGPAVPAGTVRTLQFVGQTTTTVNYIANAFTSPVNLPPPRVYEEAIRAEL